MSSNSEDNSDVDSSYSPPKKKINKTNVWDENLCSALDRTNTTDRNASIIISNVPQFKNENIALSRSTIRNYRNKNRKIIGERIKQSFHPTGMLTVHWDSKILRSLEGSESVNRIAIVVTGKSFNYFSNFKV